MMAFRIRAEAVRETEKALLVRLEDGSEEWVPQALIDDDSEVYKLGDEGELVVPEWLAEQKGWE